MNTNLESYSVLAHASPYVSVGYIIVALSILLVILYFMNRKRKEGKMINKLNYPERGLDKDE